MLKAYAAAGGLNSFRSRAISEVSLTIWLMLLLAYFSRLTKIRKEKTHTHTCDCTHEIHTYFFLSIHNAHYAYMHHEPYEISSRSSSIATQNKNHKKCFTWLSSFPATYPKSNSVKVPIFLHVTFLQLHGVHCEIYAERFFVGRRAQKVRLPPIISFKLKISIMRKHSLSRTEFSVYI